MVSKETLKSGDVRNMNFSEWLHQQLTKRNWTHKDLSQHASMAGYKISRVQITNILNENRQAGPDACIAIASGLGLPREEVFRARGWLLREPSQVVPPSASPQAAAVIRSLVGLPLETQETLSEGISAMLRAVTQVTQENSSGTPLEAPEKPEPEKLEIPKTASELLPFFAKLDHLPKPVQNETIDSVLAHLTTTLKMHQRVEWMSDWFKHQFPERYEEIEAELSVRYDEEEQPLEMAKAA